METLDGKKVRLSKEGIPQGVVLSPLIFLLYTTTIFGMYMDNTELFQFADDLCIVVWSKDMCDTTEILQKALNSILRLVTELDMDISPKKSKAIYTNLKSGCTE